MTREEWIARGDRSHPNLVELDGLRLAYEGWEDDVALAEEYHVNLPMEFQDKIFEIREKQRMYNGNRTHGRLVLLDSLRLIYPGWQIDKDKAEHYHVCLPDLFEGKVEGMKEKQKMFDGDRSHPNLITLDTLSLSYHNYQEDVKEAEEMHTSKPFLFNEKLQEIKEKQRISDGDRNHPRLKSLDDLILTYPGFVKDKAKAEEFHVRFPELFSGKLTGMKEKQKMYEGNRTHSNLQRLDALVLTYPGWRQDFIKAEEAHTHMPLEFDSRLFEIIEKQNIFIGNRGHPRLLALDALVFTYPGWQRDFAKAQEYHVRYPELFHGKLTGMKEKQRIFIGDNTSTSSSLSTNAAATTNANNYQSWDHLSEIYQNKNNNNNNIDNSTSSQSHQRQAPNASSSGECVVCIRAPKTHAFVPCGHLCVCQQCVPMMMIKKRCPICRQKATQVIKVFFS